MGMTKTKIAKFKESPAVVVAAMSESHKENLRVEAFPEVAVKMAMDLEEGEFLPGE